jgi:hypothetical protein
VQAAAEERQGSWRNQRGRANPDADLHENRNASVAVKTKQSKQQVDFDDKALRKGPQSRGGWKDSDALGLDFDS